MIFPDFETSILNVSATLAKYLGNESEYKSLPVLETELYKDYKNVVLIVMDAMGQSTIDQHLKPTSFIRKNNRQTITSVFPSTTTCATTTLLNAKSPAEHGWFAWAMNFKEISRTLKLYKNQDYYTNEKLEGENYARKRLGYEYFFSNVKNHDVYTCMPAEINFKTHADKNVNFTNTKQMFKSLNDICKKPNAKFVYAYNDVPDMIMHDFGTQSKKIKKFLKMLDAKLEKLNKKNPDTLLVITADHGMIDIAEHVEIYKDKEITNCLEQNLSLEPRAAAFHVKKEMHAKFKSAFKKYEQDFELFTTKQLIDKGVFGKFTGDKNKEFLGDFIAIAKTDKALAFKQKDFYKANHTGTSKQEMLVPLIIKGGK